MIDDEIFTAFSAGTLDKRLMNHRMHLRVVWLHLQRHGLEAGAGAFVRAFRRYIVAQAVEHVYHETLTRVWLALVADALANGAPLDDFDAFVAAEPQLADAALPLQFYRPARLFSAAARRRFVSPDRMPLPELPRHRANG